MELDQAMRTTGSIRLLRPDPIPTATIAAAIEAARFGPSGGNRQPLRWVVVREPARKRRLAELYRPLLERDLAAVRAGGLRLDGGVAAMVAEAEEFAANFGEAPAILVATARLAEMHDHMLSAGAPNLIAGSSVYPMVQNLCLALRERGVGSVITTLLCEREREVAALLELPEGVVCACHLVIGLPRGEFPRRLTRLPVDQLAFGESYGTPLA